MKFIFYASDKLRERKLAKNFAIGARAFGHEVEILNRHEVTTDCDVACMVGVKSLNLYRHMQDAGVHTLMFDKGYDRARAGGCWKYWRLSLDAHHPTATTLLSKAYPHDRFSRLGFEVKPWRKKGGHILIAGSSEKYHNFYGLPNPTSYAMNLVRQIREHTDRPIIYRPKPSWSGARPIPGTQYSHAKDSLAAALDGCHAVVTHGSNLCFEAALAGIPTIVLGDAVMKPISSTEISEIKKPKMLDRLPILNALGYHQFSFAEFQSGEAFETIGEWL